MLQGKDDEPQKYIGNNIKSSCINIWLKVDVFKVCYVCASCSIAIYFIYMPHIITF